MNDNNFLITKSDIYIAQVVAFSDIKNGYLIYKEFNNEDTFRKVLVKNKRIIDFKTGEIIYPLNIINGITENTIYQNYLYCINLLKPNIENISDNDLIYAYNLYNSFLNKKELIKSKKLIIFPPTRLN